jgi:hypothetical protein
MPASRGKEIAAVGERGPSNRAMIAERLILSCHELGSAAAAAHAEGISTDRLRYLIHRYERRQSLPSLPGSTNDD